MAKSKSTPTPTLASLRKLAKAKGGYLNDLFRVTDIAGRPMKWWHLNYSREDGCDSVSVSAQTPLEVRVVMFAALSALPDKGGPRG